jgi:hypothetical protein
MFDSEKIRRLDVMRRKPKMKKLVSLLIAVSFVLALMPAVVFAHGEDDPWVTDLIAGQHINVGDVRVWNDDGYLYVQYNTTGDWWIEETHLYVGENPPTTAAPGQFPYLNENLDGANTDLYTIPLDGWGPGTQLYGAAHAKVCKLEGEGEPTFKQGELKSVTLWAGQHIDAGAVKVEIVGENLVVTYQTKDGWELTETHLYAGTEAPTRSAPGQFPYKHEDLGGASTDSYIIPLSELALGCDDTLYIAAHAAVRKLTGYESDLDGLAAALPDGPVIMKVVHPGGDSYFNVTVSDGGVLNGTYDDWCIDTDHSISPGHAYQAMVYSSYEDLPEGLVEFPENLDLVNYIINQGYVGQSSPSGGAYTYGDVQRAIWTLIDDQQSTAGLGPWSQAKVDEILADAYANGEGFVPGCGDVVAVILAPVDGSQVTVAQVTFAEIGVPCIPVYQEETAWGEGTGFGKGWAMYFTVDNLCDYTQPEPDCETAWAFGPHLLSSIPGVTRWGWYFDYAVQ